MARIESIAIDTDRLRLRPLDTGDARDLTAWCSDWEVARWTARLPHPYALSDAETWIAAQPALWASGEEYTFAVILEDALVGGAGLTRENGVYELGYWIGRPWWGRGIATEAARALCGLVFHRFGCARMTSGHFDGNDASARVLAKCGFRYTGNAPIFSIARKMTVTNRTMELARADFAPAAETDR